MLRFPAVDPVAFAVGPVAIHWYGLAYLAGILGGWALLRRRAVARGSDWSAEQVGDMVFHAALGAVIGGRLGYALFYNLREYLADPMALLEVWRGGMSFHGGVIGFVLALAVFAHRAGRPFLAVTDFVLPVVPLGLFFGRLANFINQELWGAPSDLPWAVVFSAPLAGSLARHPTQIYEALLEGVTLGIILHLLWRAAPRRGVISGAFLCGYGAFRCVVEFLREPDAHIGYLAGGWLTMGHVLSFPMIVAGLGIWWSIRSPAREA